MRVRKFLSGNGDENSGGSLMRKSELNSVTRVSPRFAQQKGTYYSYSTLPPLLRLPLPRSAQTSKSYISVGL